MLDWRPIKLNDGSIAQFSYAIGEMTGPEQVQNLTRDKMTIIAIDPGASGGFAVAHGDQISAFKMPEGMTEQLDTIKLIPTQYPNAKVWIEKVGGYMPGNSGPAACKFARHCGTLEAGLYMAGLPTVQVTPGVWQKRLGTFSKDKAERKTQIKDLMQRMYPHLKVTLMTADALGILTYAMLLSPGCTVELKPVCECQPKCEDCKCEPAQQ